MKKNVEIGKPTEYGYSLPLIRYNLSKKYLSGLNEGLMLDFGCGNGANTILFKNDLKEIQGIDIEDERIEQAKNEANKLSIRNIQYTKYDGNIVPCGNSIYDLITSFEVLEHTNDDFISLLEINRVLKDNGLFILSVPNKWYLMETHGFNLPFEKIIPWNRIPFLSWLPKSIHSRYAKARIYKKSDINNLLLKSGFHIVSSSYIMPPFDKVKNDSLKMILKGTFQLFEKIGLDFFGVSIFIVCRKDNTCTND